MSGFLKKLKGLFILETNTPGRQKKGGGEVEEDPVEETETIELEEGGEVNRKFLDVLLRSLENNNIEGFDYLEFKQSLQSLDEMDMDEGQRYKTAFTMARTLGVSREYLLETAQHYLKTLKGEETKFQAALKNQKSMNISAVHSELSKIDESIRVKQLEIEHLKAEVTELNRRRETTEDELSSNTEKISSTEREFVVTYNYLKKQIRQDIDNIKSYLS